jgi:alpha-2-macroglobulin
MKSIITGLMILLLIIASACGRKEKAGQQSAKSVEVPLPNIPLDKGYSEYISGYTSGIISASASVEIRFTPEFAAKANKITSGLFSFEPNIKGKTEWKDDLTLVFTPSRHLEPGKVFTGGLELGKLGEVKERLKVFPLRIQTVRKDFSVKFGSLECPAEGSGYNLSGEIVSSDYIENDEAEDYIKAKLGGSSLPVVWEHSEGTSHKFVIKDIERGNKPETLHIYWDGSSYDVKQKGSAEYTVPAAGSFCVIDAIVLPDENQKIEISFSEPLDASQEPEGLIHFEPASDVSVSVRSNIISVFPSVKLIGDINLIVESTVRNSKGKPMDARFSKAFDFSTLAPQIKMEGEGVIIPGTKNLIFPFKAVNLKAVDLRIIKIYENNLPWFLQEYDLNGGYSLKRFGRPVYSGKVELNSEAARSGGWNLYTIDLSDYIEVEPGVLYKVELGMRKSYSLYPGLNAGEKSKFEELLEMQEASGNDNWDDPNYYYDNESEDLYYSLNYEWTDRNDPSKDAYYNPDRSVSRNVLGTNLGIMAKLGGDNNLHVTVSDIPSAGQVQGVTVDAYDYQLQVITTGTTEKDGSVSLFCPRKPFLIIATKDEDRSYLKTNEGSSLSLSSFDVGGSQAEKGLKAFIYGERDVWRPGDSIYLSLFIKEMINDLPPDHPVQFELINPLEQKVDNQVQKPEGKNLLVFATSTSPDAVTGNYKAVFRIGGATFTKRVRIETIKPNRLKINLKFDDGILKGYDSEIPGSMNVRWLNGTVAKNLKASVEYLLKQSKTEFPKYKQYIFDDPVNQFRSETVTAFEGSVDENGDAKIKFKPSENIVAPGMLNAVFTVKVAEPGGDESIIQTVCKYSPYHVYAGINFPGLSDKERMLYTDVENEVKVVTVDEEGDPVNSEAELSVYKLSYRWWWESDDEELANYLGNSYYKPVFTKKIRTSGGSGSLSFNIPKNEWGRYLVKVSTPGGHTTGRVLLIDWPWEYGSKGKTDGATLLSVSADKEKYAPGEEVKLSFPSPENSKVIVSLENSTGVVDQIFTTSEKGNTEVKFTVKPEMAPNIYASVTIIQPHKQTVNDMPMRLYGVTAVMVEDPQTRLSPVIKMPDEIRSQQAVTIEVSEKNKMPMSYTLAIVDEGLLDITGFRTPDPWDHFYSREALGVRTWDLYDLILGAYGGTLERIFAIGGDETVADRTANKVKRFIPVVKFLGPLQIGAGETAKHKISLPRYTGSVRVMVIAGNGRAYGKTEKTVAVKDPLMLLATAPRVISPEEKVTLPLTLFVQKEGITEVNLKAESNEMISFPENTKTLNVSGTGEKETEFTFTVGKKTGKAKIKVTASGGGESAVYELEIEVRSPNPPETRSEFKVVKPGEKWQTSFNPFGIEGSNSASLEISQLPTLNLEKRLDYLIQYPHGCSEQITSKVFPQLWLNDLYSADNEKIKAAGTNIKEGVNMLVSRQMPDGGIALWPGAYQPDTWVTSYAGHFLLEAERKGYVLPSGFRQKWVSFQQKKAREWSYDQKFRYSANDQAYRLFTLALAGQPEKGAMNRLRETTGIPQLSKWLLAASFALTGRSDAAVSLLDMRNLSTENDYWYYYYGSEERDKAIVLYTLVLLKDDEQAFQLVNEICNKFNSDNWYSTQTLSWGICAYVKWAGSVPGDKNSPSKAAITVNGEKTERVLPQDKIWSEELKISGNNNQLTVGNLSERPLYLTLTRKGIALVSDQTKSEKGIEMKVSYLSRDMKPIDQKVLEQGTDFIMVVKVSNNSYTTIENMALSEMVPSGWEIQNTRLFEAETGIKEGRYDYRDIRDDRVITYFPLGPGDVKEFVLILTAAYRGEFFQPSVYCEAMYSSDYYSRYPGTSVKVNGQKLK